MPGTNRIASGTFIAPELRISLLVTTATAAAACERGWGLRVTEVTTTLVSCSMLSCFSSLTWVAAARCWARSTGEPATSAPASNAARTCTFGRRLCPQAEEESGIGSPRRVQLRSAVPSSRTYAKRSGATIASWLLVGNTVTCVSLPHVRSRCRFDQMKRRRIPGREGSLGHAREAQAERPGQALEIGAVGSNITPVGVVEDHEIAGGR